MAEPPAIVIVRDGEGPMHPRELRRLVDLYFDDRVKLVVDVVRGIVAVGGARHSEGRRLLLEDGSRAQDLWGASYWPGRGREACVSCSAPINPRPEEGNPGVEIEDSEVCRRVVDLVVTLVGDGEALP
jgi:hypothetical protein